jgi:hypothetical protein
MDAKEELSLAFWTPCELGLAEGTMMLRDAVLNHISLGFASNFNMGAYKYLEEFYKKKQSDVLRFLLRVRCWEFRQLNVIHRASRPSRPDKARRLGYKVNMRVQTLNNRRPLPDTIGNAENSLHLSSFIGQARIRHLPYPHSSWWPQEACSQGSGLW